MTKETKKQQTSLEDEEDYGDATWGEVCTACCTHTGGEWCMILFGMVLVCFFLYFFLFGLDLLGNGAKVMSGCRAGALFGDDTNPIAGLMVGILATVLLQSSSTTTSIVVSLVGSSAIEVKAGIYMIMGANIGTSVTNTIVAMGQMGDGDSLERAFSGATVHDMFNFLTVIVLLPVEVVTGYLFRFTGVLVENITTTDGDDWTGPVKRIVGPLSAKVIKSNKNIIKDIATGKELVANITASCDVGAGYYPISCDDPEHPTHSTCSTGLIDCDKSTDTCPIFFQPTATATEDKVSGGVVFFLGIIILFVCLLGLVSTLQKMLLGLSTRIIYKATDLNGYLAMVIGAGLTVLVQSSSITTSALTPLVGMGAIRLEQMLPLTLGANIGTTVTALLASLVTEGTDALQVALAHLFFNITGILIWYPFPFMRNIPLYAARRLGKATRLWRGFPIVYIFFIFVLVPLFFLAVSYLFEQGTRGFTILGSFIVCLLGATLLWTIYYCQFQDGKNKCSDYFDRREQVRKARENLPQDMEYVKNRLDALAEHTGLPDDAEPTAVVTKAVPSEQPAPESAAGTDFDDDEYADEEVA